MVTVFKYMRGDEWILIDSPFIEIKGEKVTAFTAATCLLEEEILLTLGVTRLLREQNMSR